MIPKRILSELPQSLINDKIWVYSDENKVPIDPKMLFYNIKKGLMDLENAANLQQLNSLPNIPTTWQPAFRLQASKNHLAVVDIEPPGMQSSNPWLTLPYLYVENSRHDGLHGIVQLESLFGSDISKWKGLNKTVIKMNDIHTEILLNNHFITLTGKNPSQLYQPNNSVDKTNFVDLLQQHLTLTTSSDTLHASINQHISDYEKTPLSDNTKNLFQQLNLTPLTMPDDVDKSEWEFTVLSKGFWSLKRNHYQSMQLLTYDEQLKLLFTIARIVLPYREKHDREFNDTQHGDRVSYLLYICRKIVESVLNN